MNPKAVEHLKRAKAAMAESKKREEERSLQFYNRITSGRPWLLFKLGAIFCAILSVLLTYDTLATKEIVQLTSDDYEYNRDIYSTAGAIIWIGDEIYTAGSKDFISVDYESFRIAKSGILNQSKYLVFTAHKESNPTDFYGYQRLSVYEWFPLLQIGLLIPLFVFLFKREQAWFTFMRMTSIIIIMPAAVVILLFLLV